MNFELIQNALPILLIGAGVTIEITAFSVAVGFIIGLFVGIARICRIKILRFWRLFMQIVFVGHHCWCKYFLFILLCL